MKILLLTICIISFVNTLECQAYINSLVELYSEDKFQFARQVHGYLGFSGKILDDLGLPLSCVKNPDYSYFTGEVQADGIENQYTVYLGICFASSCSTEDMNKNGAFIVNSLLNITSFDTSAITFTQPQLQSSTTAGAIIIIILFTILILIGLKQGLQKMFEGCVKEANIDDYELASKYAVQFGQDYDPTLLVIQQKEGLFKKHDLVAKFAQYWTPQQNNKIIMFSAFRIISLPLALYGYLFYLCNFGSYNYFSFNKEIYQETFSKIALTAYYLPDVLFFISGFIFASKAFCLVEIQTRPIKPLLRLFSKKFLRLYLFYWVIILIYWQVSPTLHAGPVWSQYQKQAQQCSSSWWRVLIPIDNWFENGCYNFAWFIPAEIQLALFNIGILLIYGRNRKAGIAALGLTLLSSFVLLLTISSPLPSSMETTLDYKAQKYFKSTYSHLPFYLFGTLNAYLAQNDSIKISLQKTAQNKIVRIASLFLGSFLIILVAWRPEVWENILGFELGLARTGMFLGVYILLFSGMFGGSVRKTLIHRWAILSFGGLLIGGIVVGSSYWCYFSFPYLDGKYLLQTTIPNTIISLVAGGFLSILILPKPQKQEEPLL